MTTFPPPDQVFLQFVLLLSFDDLLKHSFCLVHDIDSSITNPLLTLSCKNAPEYHVVYEMKDISFKLLNVRNIGYDILFISYHIYIYAWQKVIHRTMTYLVSYMRRSGNLWENTKCHMSISCWWWYLQNVCRFKHFVDLRNGRVMKLEWIFNITVIVSGENIITASS